MELVITVHAKDMFYHNVGFGMDVPDLYAFAFEHIETCDDPMIRIFTNEPSRYSGSVIRKLKLREDAAKELSEHIAKQLLAEMKKQDTHNGYAI